MLTVNQESGSRGQKSTLLKTFYKIIMYLNVVWQREPEWSSCQVNKKYIYHVRDTWSLKNKHQKCSTNILESESFHKSIFDLEELEHLRNKIIFSRFTQPQSVSQKTELRDRFHSLKLRKCTAVNKETKTTSMTLLCFLYCWTNF